MGSRGNSTRGFGTGAVGGGKRVRDWAVLFRSAKGVDYVIHTFHLSEDGEKAAKSMAAKLVEVAWGKTAAVEKTKADQTQKKTPS